MLSIDLILYLLNLFLSTVPFASFVVPFLTHKLGNSVQKDSAYAKSFNQGAQFSFNSHRLTNTLFALMTTTQAIGAFTEVMLPFLQKKISQQYQEHAKKTDASKHSPSNTWLDRVREQSSRPAMELFSEYAEMVIQFGHVVLFSTAWPLAVSVPDGCYSHWYQADISYALAGSSANQQFLRTSG